MFTPDPYLVMLSARAEPDILRLPAPVRRSLRSVMEGIAEMASLIPPVNPRWLTLPGQRLPVLRVEVMAIEVSYVVDPRALTIEILSASERSAQDASHAP